MVNKKFIIINFTRVNIENSGNILVGWGGGWVVLGGGGQKAIVGVGNKTPSWAYNTHAPSPFCPTP